eukprot:CAMPEP_0195286238 /NCGR_PEP_ID=MMETSP0707-20130614/3760_1 /TAXON_ID=33640 /ORGANISM="Asterionellopsis glacialis, Strain CCMP134" /LENGTH=444 /DNA_ID=CAMNT_0040345847 /DNA_START=318 /DNA_END=1649 /DNA_ORIENTATION=+
MAKSRQNEHEPLIPTCDELMQRPFTPFADGSFLTRKSTNVVWRMRQDGSRELTLPSTCHLKRYTALEAKQCLKDKKLLFVGDSMTRYQFMALAYFLEHHKWPKRHLSSSPQGKLVEEQSVPCHDENDLSCSQQTQKQKQQQQQQQQQQQPDNEEYEPNVTWKKEWPGALNDGYWQKIGGGVDGDVFRGRMESKAIGVLGSFRYISSPLEQQEQRSAGSSPHGGRTQLSMVFEVGFKGTERFRGWNFDGCAYNASCRYSAEEYETNIERANKKDFDWDYPNISTAFGPDGTQFHKLHEDTNYVFYNRGLWGTIQDQKAKDMLKSMYEMTGGDTTSSGTTSNNKKERGPHDEQEQYQFNKNRCFYRSTTGNYRTKEERPTNEAVEYGPVRRSAFDAGCEYMDIAHITEEFSHIFNPPPYPNPNGELESKSVFAEGVHYMPWVYEEW